ncbi:MAG: hypothetical protein EHM91_15240, partial [Planctomycetota bacterium]
MNEADLSRAVSRFLENQLSPAEEQAILKDPQLRATFIEHVRLSVRLQTALHPARDQELIERTKALLASRDPGRPLRTLEAVQRRIGRRAQTRRWIGWIALAAGILVAFLVVKLVPTRPAPPEVRPELGVRTKPEPRPLPLPAPPKDPPPPPAPVIVEVPKEPPAPIVPPEKPRPQPEPVPAPPEPAPPKVEPPRTPVETKVAVARIDSLAGEAFLWTPSGRKPLRAGQDLLTGEGVQTAAGGKISIVFADKTRLDLGAGTTVRGIVGKQFRLDRGTLRAQVTK